MCETGRGEKKSRARRNIGKNIGTKQSIRFAGTEKRHLAKLLAAPSAFTQDESASRILAENL